MRTYISVLMLAARNSIYKIIGLLIVVGAVQLGVFYQTMKRQMDMGLESMIWISRMSLLCGAAFVLLCFLLLYPECEYGGSRIRYSIARLQIGEKGVFFLWTAYHVIILTIFWAIQLAIGYGACLIYLAQPEAAAMADAQSVFLAFYFDDFLHSLMPLHDFTRHIRNIFLLLGVSFGISDFSWRQRRGKRSYMFVLLLAMTLIFFKQGIFHPVSDAALSLFSIICIAYSIYGVYRDENEND